MESTAQQQKEREKLVREAFSPDEGDSERRPAVSLQRLVSLMKERSQTKGYLSSIYFAGAYVDHPFFLKNDRIAVGIATLPEDAEKAGRRKRHPHQQEVIFVLDGRLRLEVDEGGEVAEKLLQQGDVFLIPPGQCHRIQADDELDAPDMFVKTNPPLEPRSEDCPPG